MKHRISVYLLILISSSVSGLRVSALPEDQPEEILRTEVIFDGRSPIDGQALSAEDYIIMQDQIAQNDVPVDIKPEIKKVIFLLRLRKAFKSLIPF